jgi:hypothetical protein
MRATRAIFAADTPLPLFMPPPFSFSMIILMLA